jgi:hypothetical protein
VHLRVGGWILYDATVTDLLGIPGLVCLGVVLGWIGALVTRESSRRARLTAAGTALAGAVLAALIHGVWMRGRGLDATAVAAGAIAVAGVAGGWLVHVFWFQCIGVVVARARSNGVAHAYSRR